MIHNDNPGLKPATGCVNGILLSIPLWALIFGLYFLARWIGTL